MLSILVCLVIHTGVHACYRQYTMAHGLVSNTIYHSFRDSKGYLWFASDRGVSKFDGKTFKHYSTLQGLTDNSVFNFYEDTMGRIWLFTFNGAPCYLKNDSVFTANNDPLLRHFPTISFPVCMLAINDTTVYIGYSSGQVFNVKGSATTEIAGVNRSAKTYAIYDAGGVINIWSAFAQFTLKDNRIVSCKKTLPTQAFKQRDKLIVIRSDSIDIYRGEQRAFSAKISGLHSENIISSYCDDTGMVFISTDKGLIIVDGNSDRKIRLFNNTVVTSVDKDIYGNYWVSTSGNGVYCLSKAFAEMRFIKDVDNDKLVYSNEGQIFLVSDRRLYNFHGSAVREVQAAFNRLYQPLFLNDSLLLFSYGARTYAYNRQLKKYDTTDLNARTVYNYRPGHFFFVVRDFIRTAKLVGGTLKYTDTTALPAKILASAYAEKQQEVYLLSSNALYRYDLEKHIYNRVDTMLRRPLNLFYIGGKLIVVMNDQTAILYDTDRHFAKVEISTGNIFIQELYSLKNGYYLVRSNDGYYLWHLNAPGVKPVLKKIDHLFKTASAYMYPYKDSILCAADNILYTFPQSLLYEQAGNPVLFVKQLTLNHKIYSAGKPVVSKYGNNNNVAIEVGSLYFNNSENYFQYRVSKNGVTGEWIKNDGSDINIWLSDFGSYTIQLRVITENGATSPVKTIYIRLTPPFYCTWWFLTAAVLTSVFIVLAAVFLVLRNRRQKMRNELHYLQLEHKAINSLLNPHFIFNAINNIQHLVNENERDQANDYLAMLSKLIRQNIENLRFDFIPLEKELTLVKNYVVLQNLRFNHNIQLQTDSSMPVSDIFIPPLLIHTFVENAIVHGYRENITGFTIRVDLSITTDDYLVINITDNGVGYKEEGKNAQGGKISMGIGFTRKRLERLSDFYNVIHSVQIHNRSGSGERGTEVVVILYAKFRTLVPVV